MRYSWLDICPLFLFIIDWLFFGFFRPPSQLQKYFFPTFFSFNILLQNTHEERIYWLRFESFWCFDIKSAIISAFFLTLITIMYKLFTTNEKKAFDVNELNGLFWVNDGKNLRHFTF